MLTDLEQKRFILESIMGAYQASGPLPSIGDLKSCLSQMDPKELAQAIFCLEYQGASSNLFELSNLKWDDLENQVCFSQDTKNNIEKIFVAVVEYFRRMPQETSGMVDQILHYFYRALIHLIRQQLLTSPN